MFYAQQDNYSKQHNYLRATEQFFLTDKELKDLPADADCGGRRLSEHLSDSYNQSC